MSDESRPNMIDDRITDAQWDRALRTLYGSGPDPFLAERLTRNVVERRQRPVARRSGAPTPRLAAAAVLLGSLAVVGFFGWRTQDPQAGQDPKLEQSFEDLRDKTKRTKAALKIEQAGAKAVPALIKHLGDADRGVAGVVQELLAAAGEPAVARLERLIVSKDRQLQLRAIQTFGRMGEAGVPAIEVLLPVLEQADPPREIVTVLGTLIGHHSTDDDAEAADLRARVHAALFQAICVYGAPMARLQPHVLLARTVHRSEMEKRTDRATLEKALEGGDPFRRELAAELLGRHGNGGSVPKLAKALAATHPKQSSFKLRSLNRTVDVEHDLKIRLAAARSLARLAPQKVAAAPAFALLLERGTVVERFRAAEALGRLGVATPDVLRALQRRMGVRDEKLVGAVVTSLGMLGAKAKVAIPKLEAVADWGSKELKARVAAALRQIRGK